MDIFGNIEQMREVVKVNAALPWESLKPYINDATDIYIAPQIGYETIETATTDGQELLLTLIRRALGPLTMAVATDELGIQFGDTGITVHNEAGKRSPANEAKIAAAKKNLLFRGIQALERLIRFLDNEKETYTDYAAHVEAMQNRPCIIHSANEFQDKGMVDINRSQIVFRTIRPTLVNIQERYIAPLITAETMETLTQGGGATTQQETLHALAVRFMAHKAAEYMTEHGTGGQTDAHGLIRAIFQVGGKGNHYAADAEYWLEMLKSHIYKNNLLINAGTHATETEHNNKGRKFYSSIP